MQSHCDCDDARHKQCLGLYEAKGPGKYSRFIELRGQTLEAGPTSIILAGVHGNERASIIAFETLLPNLIVERGRVIFGYGNPWAIVRQKRFIEADLNRLFKPPDQLSEHQKQSYEYRKRVPLLKERFHEAEALLDLHGTRNPKSKPFVIAESNALEIVQHLPVDIRVSGVDQVTPGGTDYYMNSISKVGICVESGCNEDPLSSQRAEEIICRFLQVRGHIDRAAAKNKQRSIRVYYMHRAKDNFTMAKPFEEFEKILEGQTIGTDGSTSIVADRQSVIIFCSQLKSKPGEGAFTLGEEE